MKINNLFVTVAAVIALLACKQKPSAQQLSNQKEDITRIIAKAFVGTYTRKEGHVNGKAEGIYLVEQSDSAGHLVNPKTIARVVNPSFLKVSPDKQYLYAVSEISAGLIYTYKITESDSLVFINKLPTGAKSPCHISTDSQGEFIFVANYVGGIVKMYQKRDNGALATVDELQLTGSGPHKQQEGSHPHSVILSKDDKYVFVIDKGSDKIWSFILDRENKKLIPNKVPFSRTTPGAGPRHLVFNEKNSHAYVINELNNTITTLAYDSGRGTLTSIQSMSSLPENYRGKNSCADIHIHPSGKFLYGSNRGHNSIVAFSIAASGKLKPIGHTFTGGQVPRNFAIDKTGNYIYVANQNSDNIVQLNVDPLTGQLSASKLKTEVMTPVCIEFLN